MKPTAKRILSLFHDNPQWRATAAQIRKQLGLKPDETDVVHEALHELTAQGLVETERRRYQLVETPVSEPRPEPGEPEDAPGTMEGVFSAHPNGFGFVEVAAYKESMFVPPPYIGGAMDGDWVRLEAVHPPGRRSFARVVEVVRRGRTRIRGQLYHDHGQIWVTPLNDKLPMIFLHPEDLPDETLPREAVVDVAIVHYPEHADEAPEGRVVRVVEDAEHPTEVVTHILSDTTLRPEFSEATLKAMAALPAEVQAPRDDAREDLQEELLVTIDGEDARDFDDAVGLTRTGGGNYLLRVAIADVAQYVEPGSAVDEDAYDKGTSVYFPQQVYPMLPEKLSNELCSLKPGVPRLALTCEMELRPDGAPVDYRIYNATIRSAARLTYSQVQGLFDAGRTEGLAEPVAAMLGEMRTLATRLREKRARRGSLDFVFPEHRFELDEAGYPARIFEAYPSEATQLIEQFMLEANETVAKHCHEHDIPILYRVHDAPPPDLAAPLLVTLWNFGLQTSEEALQDAQSLRALLEEVREHPYREQVELAILKSMSQAQYRPTNDGHFALGAKHYAHFTSPIRRYPDLLLHRNLKAWLAGGRSREALRPVSPVTGVHLSARERAAADGEQRVRRLYKVIFMEPRLGEPFAASVTGVNERGIVVRLRDELVDGFLPITSLPGPRMRFDRERGVLSAPGRNRRVGLGTRLRVQLTRADRLAQSLEYAFLHWGWGEAEEADAGPEAPHLSGETDAARGNGHKGGAKRKDAQRSGSGGRRSDQKRAGAGSRR